jgi:hypothetical protein
MARRASIDVAQQPTRHRSPKQYIGPGMLRGRFRRTHDARTVELCRKRY